MRGVAQRPLVGRGAGQRHRAGEGRERREAHLDDDRACRDGVPLEAGQRGVDHGVERGGDGGAAVEVGVERVLGARGLALAHRRHRPVVPAARDPVQVGPARLTGDEEQRVEGLAAQVGHGAHPELVEPGGRDRADAPQRPHGKAEQERVLVVRPDHAHPARLRGLGGELGDELGPAEPERHREPAQLARPLADPRRERLEVGLGFHGCGEVRERLVDAHGLDEVGDLAQRRHDPGGVGRVRGEPRHHDDGRRRAEPPCLLHRHRRAGAVLPCLVRRRRDDATRADAADEHRPSAQRRSLMLLDRSEERVRVEVRDRRERAQHRGVRRAVDAHRPTLPPPSDTGSTPGATPPHSARLTANDEARANFVRTLA